MVHATGRFGSGRRTVADPLRTDHETFCLVRFGRLCSVQTKRYRVKISVRLGSSRVEIHMVDAGDFGAILGSMRESGDKREQGTADSFFHQFSDVCSEKSVPRTLRIKAFNRRDRREQNAKIAEKTYGNRREDFLGELSLTSANSAVKGFSSVL